jgi:serine/threonine-protein kinase
MPLETVASLVDEVKKYDLLEPDQLDALTSQLLAKFPDAWTLAEQMVKWAWLTPYQVKRLSDGDGASLVLAHFIILDRLGEGGVSQVFKAWHKSQRDIVALKVIHPELLHNEEAVGRFRREMTAVAKCDHPNIVKAFELSSTGDLLYLAMEFVTGQDLDRQVLNNGPLALGLACEYIRQAALGLQHIHERGLVHRDVKPANLFVTADGSTVKLLDLGLALLRNIPGSQEVAQRLTREGIMIGTPDYLPPEQAIDPRRVDIRADIYSLGCTFYFLLTGQPPFPGSSLVDKLMKHQAAEPTKTEALRPGVQQALQETVTKMMAKKPDDRYQQPGEVAAAVAPFAKR